MSYSRVAFGEESHKDGIRDFNKLPFVQNVHTFGEYTEKLRKLTEEIPRLGVDERRQILEDEYKSLKILFLEESYEELLRYIDSTKIPVDRHDSCPNTSYEDGFEKIVDKKLDQPEDLEIIEKRKRDLADELLRAFSRLKALRHTRAKIIGENSFEAHNFALKECYPRAFFIFGSQALELEAVLNDRYHPIECSTNSDGTCLDLCQSYNAFSSATEKLVHAEYELLSTYPLLSTKTWKKLEPKLKIVSSEFSTAEDHRTVLRFIDEMLLEIHENIFKVVRLVCTGNLGAFVNDRVFFDYIIALYPVLAKTYAHLEEEAQLTRSIEVALLIGGSVVALSSGFIAILAPYFTVAALISGGLLTAADVSIALRSYSTSKKLEALFFSHVTQDKYSLTYEEYETSQKQKTFDLVMAALSLAGEVMGGGVLLKNLRNSPDLHSQGSLASLKQKRISFSYDEVLHNAQLSDTDRITRAEEFIPRLKFQSDGEKKKMIDALMKAHRIGEERPNAYVFKYTPDEISMKKTLLKDAGFSDDEIKILLDSGICGRAESIQMINRISFSQKEMKVNNEYFTKERFADKVQERIAEQNPHDQGRRYQGIRFLSTHDELEELQKAAQYMPTREIDIRIKTLQTEISTLEKKLSSPEEIDKLLKEIEGYKGQQKSQQAILKQKIMDIYPRSNPSGTLDSAYEEIKKSINQKINELRRQKIGIDRALSKDMITRERQLDQSRMLRDEIQGLEKKHKELDTQYEKYTKLTGKLTGDIKAGETLVEENKILKRTIEQREAELGDLEKIRNSELDTDSYRHKFGDGPEDIPGFCYDRSIITEIIHSLTTLYHFPSVDLSTLKVNLPLFDTCIEFGGQKVYLKFEKIFPNTINNLPGVKYMLMRCHYSKVKCN